MQHRAADAVLRLGIVMLRRFASLPFGAVALLIAHVGWAQDHYSRIALDGVDRVRLNPIFVAAEEGCKLDYERIKTSIMFILNSANIPFVEGFPDHPATTQAKEDEQQREWFIPSLWVTGDVLATNSGCVYHLEVSVSEIVETTRLQYSKKPFGANVDLWSTGYIGIAPPSKLSTKLSEIVEIALKEFVNLRAADIQRAVQ